VALKETRAAGGLVWRDSGGGREVLLVHRPKYDDWSLPKGKLEPGEHALAAAVREVAEETGLRVRLGRALPPVRYQVKDQPKRVDYWVATPDGQQAEFRPTSEVDQIAWVPEAAASALTYRHDADTLAQLAAGPGGTVPLILLRHAAAGSKWDWDGTDELRPLDSAGQRDAQRLAGLLRCFGDDCRVISAPAERCLATVRPYAAAAGTEVVTEWAFAVAGRPPSRHLSASAAAAEKAAAHLAAAREPVIICAHRENMPALLAAVCAELGAAAPERPPLRKGEFLVLHRAGGQLAALERYHPAGD
jgi:8-oxo-dGTP diphosphatase